MSIIGKLVIVVVLLLVMLVAFFECDHPSWREEESREGKRWRCMDCGAVTDDEP